MQFNINSIGLPILYLGVSMLILIIGKFIYQFFHRSIRVNHEMVEEDNFAFNISQVGYYVGLLLAIGGAMQGESEATFWEDALITLAYGVIAVFMLNASVTVNDRLFFKKINFKKELIETQNVSIGVVEAANCIATGLVIYGALSVDANHPFMIVVYWLISQVLLMVVAKVYDAITSFDLEAELAKGNVAAAVSFAATINNTCDINQ